MVSDADPDVRTGVAALPEREDPEAIASRRRRRTGGMGRYAPAGLLFLGLIGVWELITRVGHVKAYLLPAPDQVASTLWTQRSTLSSAGWVTIREMLLGFVIAVAAGLLFAVVLHASGLLRRTLYPLLIGSQTVPIVVIAPILAILFGFGITPKLIVIALVCFFPIIVATLDGLRSVDPDLVRLMRTLDGTKLDTFRRVEFPAALPSLFSGVRIAATYAAIGAVFAEWSGSNNGLGYVMLQATPQLETGLVFAAIVVLTVLSVALFGVVSLAERLAVPWAHNEGGSQ